MSNAIQLSRIPSTIQSKLRRIRRQQALIALLVAVVIAMAVFIAGMILSMLIDWWFTLFDTRLRVGLTATTIAAAVGTFFWAGLQPIVAALGWKRAAASVDREIPQLEERWTTVASFAVPLSEQPLSPVGRLMLQQVTSEAVAMERLVEPSRVARFDALRSAVVLLGCSAAAFIAFMPLHWAQNSILFQRFWSPTANITATQLRSLTGDRIVPRGERIELQTQVDGLQRRSASLDIEYASGIADVFTLKQDVDEPNRFIHTLSVRDSFRYQVRAGDGQTEWHSITAIDYPALGEVELTVVAPEYVDRPKVKKNSIPARLKVVQGSELRLRMKPVSPVADLSLHFEMKNNQDAKASLATSALKLEPGTDGWYAFETQLLSDLAFFPQLLSQHGLKNEEQQTCRIQVIEDQAPFARVMSPTEEMAVNADETLDIKFEAHDDHGIATAELVIYEAGEDPDAPPKILSVQPIDLAQDKNRPHILGTTKLNLADFKLEPGKSISYSIRVTDNRKVTTAKQDASLPSERKPRPLADQLAASNSRTKQSDENESQNRTPSTPGPLSAKLREGEERNSPTGSESDKTDQTDQTNESNHSNPSVSPEESKKFSEAYAANGKEEKANAENANTENAKAGNAKVENMVSPSPRLGERGPGGEGLHLEETPPSPSSPLPDKPVGEDPKELKIAQTENGPSNVEQSSTASNVQENSNQTTAPKTNIESPTQLSAGSNDRETNPEGKKSSRSAIASNDPLKEATPGANQSSRPTVPSKNEQVRTVAPVKDQLPTASSKSPLEQDTSKAKITKIAESVMLNAQDSESSQDAETKRVRLKITEKLVSVSRDKSPKKETDSLSFRPIVVAIDEHLQVAETLLKTLADRTVADSDRAEQFRRVDRELGEAESMVTDLRKATKDSHYAFVGLQMVDIGNSHITPARDRAFKAVREAVSDSMASSLDALQRVSRAREQIDGFLKRFDSAQRDEKLAKALEESGKMYEVYVERTHRLLREARQNRHPLKRKMGLIEVDQEYLDRYAEVETMRREMLNEFGRMLGDDPRLLSRYIDVLKRRRASMREQLSELQTRQDELAQELAGWLRVDEAQRPELWKIVAEFRTQTAEQLAKQAAELTERIDKQLPLGLDLSQGVAKSIFDHSRQFAVLARAAALEAQRAVDVYDLPKMAQQSLSLLFHIREMEAGLEQLGFEHEGEEETGNYVSGRMIECRSAHDLAQSWSEIVQSLAGQNYPGLAEVDQDRIAVACELLRVEMQAIKNELEGQFRQQADADLPEEVSDLIDQLHTLMESLTFSQAAGLQALADLQLETADGQLTQAVDRFDQVAKQFDKLRRTVTDKLDEYAPTNPNIADLVDPTLDRFLLNLEREPNIEAQLGIPNRPRNLRVIAETMSVYREGGEFASAAAQAARQRGLEALRKEPKNKSGKPDEVKLSDEDRKKKIEAEEMQKMLEESLSKLKERADDAKTTSEQREKLAQATENMQRLLNQIRSEELDDKTWERLAQAEQAKTILRALARGEKLPDEQWNKLFSTLDEGLWQVRGRTLPEAYRKSIEQYQDRIRQVLDEKRG